MGKPWSCRGAAAACSSWSHVHTPHPCTKHAGRCRPPIKITSKPGALGCCLSAPGSKPRGQIPAIKEKERKKKKKEGGKIIKKKESIGAGSSERGVKVHGVSHPRGACQRRWLKRGREEGAGERGRLFATGSPLEARFLPSACHIPGALISAASLIASLLAAQVACQTDREGQPGSGDDKPRGKETCRPPPVLLRAELAVAGDGGKTPQLRFFGEKNPSEFTKGEGVMNPAALGTQGTMRTVPSPDPKSSSPAGHEEVASPPCSSTDKGI